VFSQYVDPLAVEFDLNPVFYPKQPSSTIIAIETKHDKAEEQIIKENIAYHPSTGTTFELEVQDWFPPPEDLTTSANEQLPLDTATLQYWAEDVDSVSPTPSSSTNNSSTSTSPGKSSIASGRYSSNHSRQVFQCSYCKEEFDKAYILR
jgi:hypothetical protein